MLNISFLVCDQYKVKVKGPPLLDLNKQQFKQMRFHHSHYFHIRDCSHVLISLKSSNTLLSMRNSEPALGQEKKPLQDVRV